MARWISPPGSRPTLAVAGTPSTPRNNVPRIGRVLMARGRDATRCRDQQHLRPQHARRLYRLGRRGRGHCRDGRIRPLAHGPHGPPDRPSRHDLSLRGTGPVRRASHDVPAAREPRPAARQHAAGHPAASRELRWLHDVFDNSVAIATFDDAVLRAALRQHRHARAHRDGAAGLRARESGRSIIRSHYSDDDRPDLVGALARQYPGTTSGRGRRAFSPASDRRRR